MKSWCLVPKHSRPSTVCSLIFSFTDSRLTDLGAGSGFKKGEWYIGVSDCGWSGPDSLDLLSEMNMEKYRTQRRALGPAYTESYMRDIESNLDAAITKNIGIMRERARQTVDLDMFLNMFASDIAAKLLQLQAEKGQLTDKWIMGMCMTNYGAGVETIGLTVSALVNNIVSYGWQERIHQELDSARKAGKLSNPPKLREMKEHLPYLNACLSESQRLHPGVGMPLLRTVPEGGSELEGHFLPAGTSVGINLWVFSRKKELYGEDADIWRPERWLEYSPEKLKYLETYNITFGTGARSCPGKCG
ncbi:cytochrome P450 [Cadophora sp. DSE1049]|nr:cytochrome P450 [Cadophora sp. DSE1049]